MRKGRGKRRESKIERREVREEEYRAGKRGELEREGQGKGGRERERRGK